MRPHKPAPVGWPTPVVGWQLVGWFSGLGDGVLRGLRSCVAPGLSPLTACHAVCIQTLDTSLSVDKYLERRQREAQRKQRQEEVRRREEEAVAKRIAAARARLQAREDMQQRCEAKKAEREAKKQERLRQRQQATLRRANERLNRLAAKQRLRQEKLVRQPRVELTPTGFKITLPIRAHAASVVCLRLRGVEKMRRGKPSAVRVRLGGALTWQRTRQGFTLE